MGYINEGLKRYADNNRFMAAHGGVDDFLNKLMDACEANGREEGFLKGFVEGRFKGIGEGVALGIGGTIGSGLIIGGISYGVYKFNENYEFARKDSFPWFCVKKKTDKQIKDVSIES